jgi:hypothetical protein
MLFPFQGKLGEIPTLCRNRKAGLPEERYLYATPVAGVGRFFCTKSTFSCFGNVSAPEGFLFAAKKEEHVQVSRRKFGIAFGVTAVGAAVSMACGQSPTQPTVVVGAQQPTSPLLPSPSSLYGTHYMDSRAGVDGTLEQILSMARLDPIINSQGLLVRLNGRDPQWVPGMNLRGYLFHVRGTWFGNNVREIHLNARDPWVAFDWNGRSPAGTLAYMRQPAIRIWNVKV